MELAKKYFGMEMFLAAPLGLLLELFQFPAHTVAEKKTKNTNVKNIRNIDITPIA